jgi:hypothetical protein
MMTGRVYNVPANSYSSPIDISSLDCTEWPAITVYTNSPAYPEKWHTYYYGWGAPGSLEIDYWLWDVTKTSFQIYNGFEEPHDFRWVAMGI